MSCVFNSARSRIRLIWTAVASTNPAAVGTPAFTEHPAPIKRVHFFCLTLAAFRVSTTSSILRSIYFVPTSPEWLAAKDEMAEI